MASPAPVSGRIRLPCGSLAVPPPLQPPFVASSRFTAPLGFPPSPSGGVQHRLSPGAPKTLTRYKQIQERVRAVCQCRHHSVILLMYNSLWTIEAFNTEGTEQSQGGSTGSVNDDKDSAWSFSSKDLLEKLKRYSAAGVLSYVTTFLLVWFYFSPASGKMCYAAAVERFLKLMAMVWAGSQVTKILRAGGALALAPLVDRGLRWFTVTFNFKSEGKAFATIVGFCFALAALLFFGLTILWA